MLVKLNIAPIKVYSRLSGIYELNKYIPYRILTEKQKFTFYVRNIIYFLSSNMFLIEKLD